MRLDATIGKGRSIFTSVCPGVSWTFFALCQRAGLKEKEKKKRDWKILLYNDNSQREKRWMQQNSFSIKPTCSSAPRLPAQSGCCSRGWWFAPFLCAWGHQSLQWLCWWCGCRWAWRPAVSWCSECRLWWMRALCSVEKKKTTLRKGPLLSTPRRFF